MKRKRRSKPPKCERCKRDAAIMHDVNGRKRPRCLEHRLTPLDLLFARAGL